MAAPNIAKPTLITGKTVGVDLSSTDATDILANAASSGKVFKVNSLYVANVDGTNACNVTITVDGKAIASTISVPANSTLVAISKEAPIYLEENKKIIATAGVADDLEVVCSYEEIS